MSRVFSRAIGLLPRNRKKTTVWIERELLEAYEKLYPRTSNGFQGASLSDDVNKALAIWFQMQKYIE